MWVSSYGAEEHIFEYDALKHLFESSNNALLVSVGYVQLTESQIELQTSWTIKKKKNLEGTQNAMLHLLS